MLRAISELNDPVIIKEIDEFVDTGNFCSNGEYDVDNSNANVM